MSECLASALNAANGNSERLVRINSRTTGMLEDDLEMIVSPSISSNVTFSYRPLTIHPWDNCSSTQIVWTV